MNSPLGPIWLKRSRLGSGMIRPWVQGAGSPEGCVHILIIGKILENCRAEHSQRKKTGLNFMA